jgi:ATP-binding cassette subfamily F protein uup
MAVLISCQSISKTFGVRPIFQNISLTVSDNERIGLIGPNGAGKSTLLEIIAGAQTPDSGVVAPRKGLRLAIVPQNPEFDGSETVAQIVEQAITDEHVDEHEKHSIAAIALGRAGFTDHAQTAGVLSGGWRKRLAVARELVKTPELLLLDEPTNHLDLDGILWLEGLIKSAPFACMVVSHDRYFLENVGTDTIEINRTYPDGLFRVKGNYSEFLLKREEFLEAQSKQQEALANKVRREVEWLRRGPKARTTKSKARIDTANEMIRELADLNARNATQAAAQIDFSSTDRRTKRLLVAKGLSKEIAGRTLFRDLSLVLAPGVRVGLVGPNGSGKTTLLRVLLGQAEADAGTIDRADNLRTVYFDQNREQLDMSLTLRRALAPDADSVLYRDRVIHVASWAARFLFNKEQLDMSVSKLSGGERARVHIARLMLQPADILLLDEPTNDLDIPTLEVLEDSLLDFPGALVLVTHDRYMLDRVSTIVAGLDGKGGCGLFADYSQWEEFQSVTEVRKKDAPPPKPVASAQPAKKKLSYTESREWEQMESRIQEVEAEIAARHKDLEDPAVTSDAARLTDVYEKLQRAQAAADKLYERWAELESKLA